MSVNNEAVNAAAPERHRDVETALVSRVLKQRQIDDRKRSRRVIAQRILVVFAFLALWEFASGRFIDDFFTSSPLAIAEALVRSITERRLLWHAQITIIEAVSGYVIGSVIGITLALMVTRFDKVYDTLQPLVLAVYGIPRIALAPLFITWFGIGITSKIVISAFMVFFIVFMNTVAGIYSAHEKLIQTSRLMGASKNQILLNVMLPSALPYIMTALRIVVPTAMIGAIVGEFISAQRGLGFFISRATFSFDIAGAFSAIFVLMIVVVTMNGIVTFADRRLMKWRSDDAGPTVV